MGGIELAEHNVRAALHAIGFQFTEGTEMTPKRIVKYWEWLLSKPEPIKWTMFEPEETDGMVVIKDIRFASACEHHFLPFFGKAHIAYIPKKKIVGLSKIPRLVTVTSKSPQTQEYLTNKIAEILNEKLDPIGVAVVMDGEHTCMSCRGAMAHHSVTRTSKLIGAFKNEQETRNEFFSLINNK